ncbi:MAG: thiamine phosphate synthase [Acidobacteria bacterium]|nr:thiamine phosphate synthase [Acidobacteriota bacterium]
MALCYSITARHQLQAGSEEERRETALQEKVRAAFAAGTDFVQVREKDLPGGRLASLVERLSGLPQKKKTRLLVNERLDVAITCGAEGVHLPSDSIPLPAVRARGGEALLVGISCHSLAQVEQAAREGASYILLGPVFETPSKPGAPPLGLALLAESCRRSPVPVFALGGVDLGNAAACIRAGAAGVAGIRLFQQAQNLEEVCGQLQGL